MLGREILERGAWAASDRTLPRFIPPPPNPPALGGRGTERDHAPPFPPFGDMAPRCGIRILLFAVACPASRFGMFIGRCMPALFAAGRCIAPLFIGPAERCVFIGRDEPIPNPVFAPALACTVEVIAARLTTGRAKLRGGGAAALIPALGPSMVARFGFTSSVCTGVILLSSFGETRIAFRATD
jgi:hypothetical protein